MQMNNEDQSIIFNPSKNDKKISLSKIELSIVKNLPTLVKAYLRLGAKIGDGAVIDYVVKTTDIFIYLPYKNISKTYLKKFI